MEKIRLNSTSIQVKKISLYISKMLALKTRTKSRPEIKKKIKGNLKFAVLR